MIEKDGKPAGEEYGTEYTDEELEKYFKEAENEEPYVPFWQSKGVKRFLAVVISLMLCANVIAFIPRIFSLPAIQFLKVSAQLSQSADVQQYKQAVVVVTSENRKGTGFHISSGQGIIVTNRHVVGEVLNQAVATFPNGTRYAAEVIYRDPAVDLAILDIGDSGDMPALELSEASTGMEGKPVYVIGNPLFFNGIANEGVVAKMLEDRNPPLMAVQAPIYKGNSGSPVIGRDGQVIGVIFATSTIDLDGERQRIGLAVPVEWVWKYINQQE